MTGLTHHRDKGIQYVRFTKTHPLAGAGIVASVGSTSHSYDNAGETFNSLFKAGLVCDRGPWNKIDDLDTATAEYIDWLIHQRIHVEIGMTPTAEFEDDYYRRNTTPATVEASVPSLH